MFVIQVPDPGVVLSIWQQIDARLRQVGEGNPNGVVAAAEEGNWYWDKTAKQIYICTATDGLGNPANTTWEPQNFITDYATTSTEGIVRLAVGFDSEDNTLALTGASIAGSMASINGLGVNTNITALEGLTTPLSAPQGGTGYTTFIAALKAALPSMTGNSGKVFSTDGTDITLVTPNNYMSVITPSSDTVLSVNQLVLLSADGFTHTLPTGASKVQGAWVDFVVKNVSNVVIETADGSKIEGSTNPLQVDKPYSPMFRLTYQTAGDNWVLGV